MDIKFSSIHVVFVFAILSLVVVTTSAGHHKIRGAGRISSFRRQNRREVRDYLAPPSQDASYTSYGAPSFQSPPLTPYRPGRLVDPPPPTESPGYFSRLASWLNPFGGSPTPPPFPEMHVPKFVQPYAPSQPYGPPPPPHPPLSYGPPIPQPPPPAGPSGYLPSKVEGKDCNPCNEVPWIPLPGVVSNEAHPSEAINVEIQPSLSEEGKHYGTESNLGFAEEVRTPDFSYGLPSSFQFGPRPASADFTSHANPPAGPIPYPHLYPGAMPPLFKANPFHPSTESFAPPTPSIQLEPNLSDHSADSISPGDGHVEVLPPGAEVDTSGFVGEIRDSPPPGYEEHVFPSGNGDAHPLFGGHENTDISVQQAPTIHEEHLSTELSTGYKVQSSPTSVEVVKSIPTAEFSASVQHPVQYEQSPLIDLTKNPETGSAGVSKDYTAGLNPPPKQSAETYENNGRDTSKDNNNNNNLGVPKDSYGHSLSNESVKDSSVASSVTNKTFFYPTPSYGIPDAGGLPISHEAAKSNTYENYPPSTEKFLISVTESVEGSESVRQSGESSQADRQNRGKIVDSYQHHIEQPTNDLVNQNGQSGFINTPEPLVPYRPSSLYVPYPPYTGPNSHHDMPPPSVVTGPTTEEPFLDALLKSYDNFKREMDAKDKLVRDQQQRLRAEVLKNQGGSTWVSQPQPSFAVPGEINPSVYSSGSLMPPPVQSAETKQQPSGVKKNKQVQIIIPYTSQYTPSPFQPVADDWSGRGPLEKTQGRKVPKFERYEQNYVGQESQNVEIKRPLRPLENLLSKEVANKSSVKQTNNSIDVSRLQKNIDNWTIQEYSRGLTASTALPSSSHPYLLQSKKIPNEYLNGNKSSVSEERIDTNRPDPLGLNYNDLDHEGAASSRVDVPHVQVVRIKDTSKEKSYETISLVEPTTSSPPIPPTITTSAPTPETTTTEASWGMIPVSISPHNNEKVYVVTPQPVRSAKKSWPDFLDSDKSAKFEAIEKAYQVLPQAVNNLATTSVSGPENSPLWGIMEHDQYARSDKENSTANAPILYSGHSKVSNAGSQ